MNGEFVSLPPLDCGALDALRASDTGAGAWLHGLLADVASRCGGSPAAADHAGADRLLAALIRRCEAQVARRRADVERQDVVASVS